MKKTNYFIVLGICFILLGAISPPVFGNLFKTYEFNALVFEYNFNQPVIEKYNENYNKITIDDLPVTHFFNKPCIPVKPLKILLPYGSNVKNIEVITGEKTNLGKGYNPIVGGRLFPISVLKQNNFEEKNELIKAQDSKNLYEKVGVYSFRGFSILHINLYPVTYDAHTGSIFFYEYMKIIIETEETDSNNAFRGLSKDYELVNKIVDNPELVETYKSQLVETSFDESYDYIIITNNKFKRQTGQNTFQSLLDYKENKGLKTKMVTVGEILLNQDYSVNGAWGDANPDNPFYQYQIEGDSNIFDDTSARIRNFIRFAYMEWGVDFVLLGGDGDIMNNDDNIIPPRGLFANESGLPLDSSDHEEEADIPSDVYFACLDGNFNYDCDEHFGESEDRNDLGDFDEADLYAEVWVGRACVDSEEEVSNFVKKTLFQEEVNEDYLYEVLFVGEDLGTWYSFYYRWGGEYKDDMAYLIPDQFNLNIFYDRDHPDNNWMPTELYDEILRVQPQIINHDGHGYTDYMLKMGSASFFEFENEKPFFIYSHSCLTGSFDNYKPGDIYVEGDCIAEILTCGTPYGAFACILNARYGLGSETDPISPSGAYDESFYKALFEENIKQLGAANHYSKEDNVWRINQNGYRWCYYQTNLFGDPELRIKDPTEQMPNKPSRPTGSTEGNINEEYTYSTSTNDPNGKQIYYKWDWGDDTFSEWIGPYNSGETCEANNIWTSKGDYQIKVIAKNTDELMSEWSDPLSVTMPKNKVISGLTIFNLLEKFFSKFLCY